MTQRLNYDRIAPTYDARYSTGVYTEVLDSLRNLVAVQRPDAALEVGCGTGYWLYALRDLIPRVYGLDFSLEMLRKAAAKGSAGRLARGTAVMLPFRRATFDLIFCVNAIHHFPSLDDFVAEARSLMRPGGTLAVLGMDPHHGHDKWCVYDYFPETKAIDLARYPSSGQIIDSMLRAGFDHVESAAACRFSEARVGSAIFDDPELARNGCSQMALLTDDQYTAGIARIKAAIARGNGTQPMFGADIAFMLLEASVDR